MVHLWFLLFPLVSPWVSDWQSLAAGEEIYINLMFDTQTATKKQTYPHSHEVSAVSDQDKTEMCSLKQRHRYFTSTGMK